MGVTRTKIEGALRGRSEKTGGSVVIPQTTADPALDRELALNGYATVPLLDAQELEALQVGFRELRPADGFAPDGTGMNTSSYHCTFLDADTTYKQQANELIERVFGPALERMLADYRILTSNFYVKPSGTGRFQMHQNWPTITDLSRTTLTVWCPLHDVDKRSGTIHVVPGSHKIVPDTADATDEPFFRDFEDQLIADHLISVELKAGQGVVFDDSLIHWSPENQREEPRRAVQIELVPRDETAILHRLDRASAELRWELVAVDEQFYIDHSIGDAINPPDYLPVVGHSPYLNRKLTYEEFTSLLARGDEIRSHVYAHGTWPEPDEGDRALRDWASELRQWMADRPRLASARR